MLKRNRMGKSFIITVDTEGEGGWDWKPGDPVQTRNADFVERFQQLCDRHGFKPVYLTNYEMASDRAFMENLVEWERQGRCEIGIHLHAWNNPPHHPLDRKHPGQDYLIEYPADVMEAKYRTLHDKLAAVRGVAPTTHRSGRWAMDDRYFGLLERFGVTVDCSYTPGLDWSRNMGATRGGSDYRNVPTGTHMVGNVLEVPMTVRHIKTMAGGSLRHKAKCLLKGSKVWLRPASQTLGEMKKLIRVADSEPDTDYVEFMVHSSELMPGGSPYFPDQESIERLYDTMDLLFAYARQRGYTGVTLQEYRAL